MAPVHQSSLETRRHATKSTDLIAYLKSGAAFDGQKVNLVETHMSYIFLTHDRAYKLKKPIKLTFADFSTIEARQIACEREVDVNLMYPSGLYLGVKTITQDSDGFAIDGAGEPVDWLVEMKKFDRANELDKLAKRGVLDGRCIDQLADIIAEQHRNAEPILLAGAGQPISVTVANVAKALHDLSRATSLAELVDTWEHQISQAVQTAGAKLDLRRRHGFVKRCHGDLHLANICLVDGRAMPFDAIEFSEELATIDVLYDAAFPIMDLIHHGKPDLTNQFLNRYLSATQDYSGTDLIPLFLSLRAAVRAMTALMALNRSDQDRHDDAAAHIGLANHLLEDRAKPSLIAIGGLSGTGKSSVAKKLAIEIVPGAGAILLRSDVIRKRLAGISPENELPSSGYSRRNSQRVYEQLFKLARHALNAGQTVILDAVFLEPEERDTAAALATMTRTLFHGLWLEVQDVKLLQRRISKRVGDASDATGDVVKTQTQENPGLIDWHHIDASPPLDQVTNRCFDLVRTISPARWPEPIKLG